MNAVSYSQQIVIILEKNSVARANKTSQEICQAVFIFCVSKWFALQTPKHLYTRENIAINVFQHFACVFMDNCLWICTWNFYTNWFRQYVCVTNNVFELSNENSTLKSYIDGFFDLSCSYLMRENKTRNPAGTNSRKTCCN